VPSCATPDHTSAAPPLESSSRPLVSVVVLNYHGHAWMRRCLESLQTQTLFHQSQIIVADNASTDGSDRLAEELMQGWENGLFIQNGANLGFGAGSNLAVKQATGQYLLFLNPDVWLEPDCLEQAVRVAEEQQAGACGVLVRDYDDDNFQSNGAAGFDVTGQHIGQVQGDRPVELFCANGFFFIRTDLFRRIGGFDDTFFLYGEEGDLSWRVWISGQRILYAPQARIHHRGAASANPKGGTKIVELRTSDSKRYYSNRNHLLTLLKNCRGPGLLMVPASVLFLLLESLAGAIFLRRAGFIQRTWWAAVRDCWRMRAHVLTERRRIRGYRVRGDLWMLRFLRFGLGRWADYQRMFKLGKPIVEAR
jgi:N-acetylglucosaminyl-diphospho-decaprenol L-rhamnosyltransferase